eukprot:scaffold193_cov45-Phaeocystis_antarctica.AAC.4
MTSLDLPSEHPLPADSQVDAEGAGMHSGEEEDYEQSAAAALLGMASALPMYRSLSQNSPGSFKRELDDPRQLLSDSRGSSSDDLSSIYSNGGGGVKRQRSETKDHGGAHTPFPAPRAARQPHGPLAPERSLGRPGASGGTVASLQPALTMVIFSHSNEQVLVHGCGSQALPQEAPRVAA